MLNFLSATDVANEISMTRSKFRGTYLVVEGTTDVRLYGKFLSDDAKILAASSKSNVRNIINECHRRNDDLVMGIIDKDIDGMLGKTPKEPVFCTDLRDIECMMLCSPALDSVLSEYADKEALERFTRSVAPVRTAIANGAAPIGALMYLSYKKGMSLSFKDLNHGMFISRKNLSADITKMVQSVYSQSMGQLYSPAAMADQVREMIKKIDDPWIAVRGHDGVSVLTIGLRHIFGSYNTKYLDDHAVAGSLRLSYSEEMFAKSMLFRLTSDYAKRNNMSLWHVTQTR